MYRPEHPNPIFERKNWLNLNGKWEFEIDYSDSGLDRKFYECDHFSSEINVPFCPESELSGIANKDFMQAVWYKRTFSIDAEKTEGRILLHFGAVDYEAHVFVNEKKAGIHKGGYSSFALDITELVVCGENSLVICARDNIRNPLQPRGKQTETFHSKECDYTRTTGIWQTVWLEFVPKKYVKNMWVYPNTQNGSVTVKALTSDCGKLKVEAFFKGVKCGEGCAESGSNNTFVNVNLNEIHLWDIDSPDLYDLKITFGDDEISSYFGLREVTIKGNKFLLNGRPVFQRLVLDQGFYPKGIYTAPTDEDLVNDIQLSLDAGFNGARLHEKVFEPRFLYHCDRMGYMVWGEYPNWGLDISSPFAWENVMPEWMEVLERDFNHPSIIGWCPFNETWDFEGRKQRDSFINNIYKITKAYDTTRPCIDSSGAYHVETDIFDVHDYEQDPSVFAAHFEKQEDGREFYDSQGHRQTYTPGTPIMVSEFGGIGFAKSSSSDSASDSDSVNERDWSYGNAATTKAEFLARYEGLVSALLSNAKICAFCYTQLYDIEQEVNGLYTYDRAPKIDINEIKKINSRKAAIEN